MGADQFMQLGVGRDSQEAFRSARESAAWEYGHGGYTGTLAEKGDFVEFKMPPRMTLPKLRELVEEYTSLGYEAESDWPGRTKAEQNKLFVAKTRARVKMEKIEARLPQIKQMAEVYGDKWGPALCVEITGKTARDYKARSGLARKRVRVFGFFGLASS